MQKIFILLSFFIISFLKPGKSVAQINSTDSLALVALYNSTNGAGWTNHSGWLAGRVINWYGVSTNGNSVSGVVLSNNNLIGTIPSAIGNMGNLTDLELDGNQLSGSIPSSFGNLTNLVTLVLSNNQLSGTIPSIGNLTNLGSLALDNNQLNGSITTTLGNLTNLGYLSLSDNQLSGTIPYSFGNLVNLNTLYLYNNQLTGSIPGTLGKMVNMEDLELYNNQLSGSIPDSLNTLVNLNTLDFSFNQLSGTIPASLSNLVSLNGLNLFTNQLSGSIPSSLGSISSLNSINLGTNQLTGTIPSTIANPPSLIGINLSYNQLSGSMPASLGNSNLYFLTLNNNLLSGTVPSSFTNLINSSTYIDSNYFTFDGLEIVAPALTGLLTDSPQAVLPLHLNGSVLSVYAGGTLSNNTYYWYKDGVLISTQTGDSTFSYVIAGHYSVVIKNSKVTNSASGLILYSDTIIAGIILPVTYLNFTGSIVSDNTQLRWQTSSEINTSYFNVQRSLDGVSFTTIGKVDAAGISSSVQNYHYTDNLSSIIGTVSNLFYRLQETDQQGNTVYSSIVKVVLNQQLSLVSIYPNPVKDLLTINSGNNSGNARLEVFDINGARLFLQSQTVQQNNTISINTSNLARGIYVIQVTINGLMSQQKFVKE